MNNTKSSIPATQLPFHQPRRTKRRAIVTLGALLLLIAACCVSYAVVSRSRYKVIGKVEPATGYQIEYTVSSRYRKSDDLRQSDPVFEGYNFKPNPPLRALQWIYSHIVRRPKSGLNLNIHDEVGVIKNYCFKGYVPDGITIDDRGYPKLLFIQTELVDVVEEKMLVSGCPATCCSYSLTGTVATGLRSYSLLIKPKDQPVVYMFTADDDTHNPSGVADEMKKIMDSIRISKVK